MIISLEGNAGFGKSSFGYTSPLPLVCGAFDAGVERALFGSRWKQFEGIDIDIIKYPPNMTNINWHKAHWQRNEGKSITVYLLPTPVQTSLKLAGMRKLWNDATILLNEAIYDQYVATVMFDTMTLARRVAADAYLEDMQNDQSQTPTGQAHRARTNLLEVEWGKPADMVRNLYSTAQNQAEAFANVGIKKNFVMTHHLQDTRDNVPQSDGSIRSLVRYDSWHNPIQHLEGLANTYRFVDVAMRFSDGVIEDPFTGVKSLGVIGEFMKCGYDLSKKGTKFEITNWDGLARYLNADLAPRGRIPLRYP